ncbi:YhdH/YhfP family quinone oxidoreductase [Bythopirellula goksoeyrii]|uniref:Putative acrylyl-CoA reductase AcuI n=1 Tax=Bythopirellula goksoeyrii TaxID=1400387 RepID=A0A5B9Q6X6_9BACT|nr:YhdH/YhfP family quinone oxidoreductase [Bythopirellula goksoeyrii]QEG33469.1 putative acrylyl-CoA reductase AcuI [Bythopirellula goksoeyrii]
MPMESFPALIVRREDKSDATFAVEQITRADLPAGDVVIEVEYSSLNYKDALACHAHPGVVRQLPHVPGIDCAGKVLESTVADFSVGDSVLVTGYDLGSGAWGGYSAQVRVPAAWVVPMPKSLTPRTAMLYGTAGFTAAQCVHAIQHHGVGLKRGEVVVTGATGGVGSIAVALLAKLGYQVVAVTGKPEFSELLQELGAQRIIGRTEVDDESEKQLLPSQWSAAVDTVGGNTLATLLRSTAYRGCVAACGLVGGDTLPLTVYPFILRGVTLCGIDSAKCPREPRMEIWDLLSGEWNVAEKLEPLAREVSLNEISTEVAAMLAGKNHGRILVRPSE